VNGYFDKFLEMIDHAVAEGFIKPAYRDSLVVETEAEQLLQKISRQTDAVSEDWVDSERI